MSIYDRDYHQADYQPPRPHIQMRLPAVSPAVKYLLIINIAVFFICIIIKPLGRLIYEWFSVDTTSPLRSIQLWRLLGYQFLHDPSNIWHLAMNMLGLYFLGPTIERYWGSRKFLTFYLLCGAAGGIFYIALTFSGIVGSGVLIGASGAILGMLAACAILFPQFVVFLFIFPVPIRLAAMILTGVYIVSIFTGAGNAGGDAAHLAGMAAGAGYVYLWPRLKKRYTPAIKSDDWEKRFAAYSALQKEVDRILEKVSREGINSLSRKEKKMLADATKLEQAKNNI